MPERERDTEKKRQERIEIKRRIEGGWGGGWEEKELSLSKCSRLNQFHS